MTTTWEKIENYRTTESDCDCADRYYRQHECKHMAAVQEAMCGPSSDNLIMLQAHLNEHRRERATPRHPVCVNCGDIILNPDYVTWRRGDGWCAGCDYETHLDAGGAPLRYH